MATDDVTGVMDQQETGTAKPEAPRPAKNPAGPAPGAGGGESPNLDMLLDVNLRVTVELGRARLKFRDVMNLAAGSIVELSKQVSEPVDILVNGALLATGEVVVVDDHFAVRINKLLNRVDRMKRAM
jgi:flagellar motor switch protein FliN/FliY